MINAVSGLYWQIDAACLAEDPELFYTPSSGGRPEKMSKEQLDAARAVCSRCPVRDACLDWALEHGEIEHGVWGGLAPHERKTEQRRRRSESWEN